MAFFHLRRQNQVRVEIADEKIGWNLALTFYKPITKERKTE